MLTLDLLKVKARRELEKLDFPANLWLELYWICCGASDYNLDCQTSFHNIVIPTWLPLPFDPSLQYYKIILKTHCYPPPIYNERDIEFEVRRHGNPGLRELYRKTWEHEPRIFLPCRHELYHFLNKLKGSPKILGKPGRHARYPDRLIVKCAVWKDRHGMTYEKIGNKIGLPDKVLAEAGETDVARYLVGRGRKLIASLTNSV